MVYQKSEGGSTMNQDQSSNRMKTKGFTIISNDPNAGHGGYGAGSISLENMSSVIVDPENNEAYVDMDAMHARSKIERRVKYMKSRDEVPIQSCIGSFGLLLKKE